MSFNGLCMSISHFLHGFLNDVFIRIRKLLPSRFRNDHHLIVNNMMCHG
ncbi:Uncharacterised protein [Vibrio cholerae]|nr:Uncharacterised protein [Vibrio cholerae]